MKSRTVKRILIFLLFPILLVIPFITNEVYIQIIAGVLLVIYVGLLVFFRSGTGRKTAAEEEMEKMRDGADEERPPETDDDESFTIISRTPSADIITDQNYVPSKTPKSPTTVKPPDLKEQFLAIATEELPDELGHDGQFAFVLEKILAIIKESYHAHSILFFWYNKKQEQLMLEKYLSQSKSILDKKIPLEDDILSKIVENAEPELLTNITPSAEADALRYYSEPQKIKSFVGAPLFYNDLLVGVLAMDSRESDAFGIETVFSLGRFVRLITIMISLFEDKYAESLAKRRLRGLLNFIEPSQIFDTDKGFMSAIEKSMESLLPWDAFAFVYFKPTAKKFVTAKVINTKNLKYIGENLEIELNDTLVGKSILAGSPVKIDDTSAGQYRRYSSLEDVGYFGSFLAVPILFKRQNFGVLCFDNLKKNAYTTEETKLMLRVAGVLGYILAANAQSELMKKYISKDIETGAYSNISFMEQVGREMQKASDMNVPASISLISIDDFSDQTSLFEGDNAARVVMRIADMIRKETNHFSTFGRINDMTFAVYQFNTKTTDTVAWAEKLRQKIARQPISVMSHQTTFTVSIGIASGADKENPAALLHEAELAMKKAQEDGGNKVLNLN